jgi:hypothetical protein
MICEHSEFSRIRLRSARMPFSASKNPSRRCPSGLFRRNGYATQGDGDARPTRVALPWADLSSPFRAEATRTKRSVRLLARNRVVMAMAGPDRTPARGTPKKCLPPPRPRGRMTLRRLADGRPAAQRSQATAAHEPNIGIGVRVAPEPLPHHLASGSALGGSSLGSKLRPDA